MAERMAWSERFALGVESVFGTAVATTIGYPLTGHPALNPGQNVLDTRKAIGVPYRHAGTGMEFQQTTRQPTSTWPFEANSRLLTPILWSLFQSGAIEVNSTPYVKYFIPYEVSDCEMWATLLRSMAPSGTASSHRIISAMTRSLQLSGEEAGALVANAEWYGRDFESNRDVASDTLTVPAIAPLLFQDVTITLGGTTVNIPSFSITIGNGGLQKNYDSQGAIKNIIQDLTVEGTITIPWAATTVGGNQQITDFINGNVTRLVIYWGKGGEIATTSADLSIICHIRRTNAEPAAEDEISIPIPFI